MQYLRGKMTAVTSAARRELVEKQGTIMSQQALTMPQQQPQLSREAVMKQGPVVSDMQKRKVTEMEESSEVKRVKINTAEMKTENIMDEEWKQISLGIEQQTSAIHLKPLEKTESKVGEFVGQLRRTVINKPLLPDRKPTASGNVSDSKVVIEHQMKTIKSSDGASLAKQKQTMEKAREKHGRWDLPEKSEKGKKYDDNKRSHQKQSPLSRHGYF